MKRGDFFGALQPGEAPALLVVDMSVGFTDPSSPLACGLEEALGGIKSLLDTARHVGLPVVYTSVMYDDVTSRIARTYLAKAPALRTLEAGSRWVEIDPRIAPQPGEPVLPKLFASAFFATPLASLLTRAGVDTVMVTGASTSGCVRATVVDAMQLGYVPIVVTDAVGDRDPDAHQGSLRDMGAKYAELLSVAEACSYLGGLGSSREGR